MKEERFSPEQSLHLIQSMISKTKEGMSDNSIYFLVWGWITFTACVGQYVLKHFFHYERHYIVWLLIIAGILFSILRGRRDDKTIRVKTYLDESMKKVWGGMAIGFVVLSLLLAKLGWGSAVFPFFIMLYGLGTFISGSLLQFRPLIIGGICAWLLAIGSTFANYDYQMLFGAAAILISYIIPAYLLRQNRKIANP